jgi:RimJ/RimL family protein N-acetyltransferase
VITLKADGTVIGMLDARPKAHMINIGYVLAQAHWGNGYMPEAVRALTELALSIPSIYRVEASCDVDNVPSARTLEKSGFAKEGRLARYNVHPNISQEPRDCWLYAKTR